MVFKRNIVTIIVAFLSLLAQAQTLSVESFKLLESDLTANTKGTQEHDQNGQVAALIKVVTSEMGFVFDGGMMGIVKTAQKTGEIWVYVPAGIQKITIQHQQLGVLRDYYFPVSIEKGRTYELRLLSGTVRTIVENQLTAQFVLFSVNPVNATVTIDETPYPLESDGTTAQLLSYGNHTYRVEAPGYVSESGQIQVGPERLEKQITLKSVKGTITIVCDMAEAEIWLNETKVGTGQWTGERNPAMYLVEAKRQGYRTTSTSFTLNTQEQKRVSIQSPIPIYGSVSISSVPSKSVVVIDGKEVGDTPLLINDILVGTHQLVIQKSGYNSVINTIIVKEGDILNIKEELKQQSQHEYVDLGLSVKWATCNVGARKPEEYGDYFAWGTTEPLYESGYAQENPQLHWKTGKSDGYIWSNTPYQTANTTDYASTKWTKYLGSITSSYKDASATDTDALKTVLDLEDDAAHANWGGNWRIPTIDEWNELNNSVNCTWTWTTINGIKGYKVQSLKTGYTDNWIFLPAAGCRCDTRLYLVGSYGRYWSSSLRTGYPYYARYFFFDSSNHSTNYNDRDYGPSVRPVCQ